MICIHVTWYVLLCTFLPLSSHLYCFARDTITNNSSISDSRGDSIISVGKIFELGFFTLSESSVPRRYLGIWYYGLNTKTVVWVANRDEPIPNDSGVFTIDGASLKVVDRNRKSYWTQNLTTSSRNLVVKLMDSGNLVLRDDDQSGKIIWQSFENVTDTFLSGMKMDENVTLKSWKTHDDPSTGNYTFKQDEGVDQFIIMDNLSYRWKSGQTGEFSSSEEMPSVILNLLSNFTKFLSNSTPNPNYVKSKIHFPRYPNITNSGESSHVRLVMSFDGEIQYWQLDSNKTWFRIWRQPYDQCSVFHVCGKFASCNINNELICKCLPGFVPASGQKWNSRDFYDGCTRKSTSCGNNDSFLSLKMIGVDKQDSVIDAQNETECSKKCLDACKPRCQAYSYQTENYLRSKNPSSCFIWTDDLKTIQEQYTQRDQNIFVRVATSDIESTSRDCKTCGTNIVPYPLSTGPNCGDPMYKSFLCINSTGQLNFTAPSGIYRVTQIDPDKRKFSILQENQAPSPKLDNCNATNVVGLTLNKSLPFSATNVSSCSNVTIRIEISWNPPREPICTSSADCKGWLSSTCGHSFDGAKRCLCNKNFQWNGTALNCTRESVHKKRRNVPLFLIVGVVVTSAVVLSCSILYIYLQKRKRREDIHRNTRHHMYGSERHVKHFIDSVEFKEEDKKGIDVPFYDLKTIIAATDNFSDINKLGQGGYGPVYKGNFPGGQEIAVKRLSNASGQGLKEFKNEVVLIAKLQHRNLVRLLGYCIEGHEMILIYEYMPNKSLDTFVFDRMQPVILEWQMLFNIILGIARGLLYLHQDSRLRIIHRDLKTSNILLDAEMNPKISDFGLAKIFGGKQNEDNTNRVVGTFGYMSPEYALDGNFSVKSDVFSFGVVLLEIISGKRNTRFCHPEQPLSLLGYAWRSWSEEKLMDFLDERLLETCDTNEYYKCVCVGLLCVQEDPNDRPTMSNVIFMLGSEIATLPTPKQPAFILRRGNSSTASSSNVPEIDTQLSVR